MPAVAELDVYLERQGSAAAVFDSSRREYRYLLTRVWNENAPPVVFVMLNPSTADAMADDPTIRRCKSFADREGAGGIVVVNLFALRSTDPRALLHHDDPVGPVNDLFIHHHAVAESRVIAAWGAAGVQHGRGERVTSMLRQRGVDVRCFGTTATGQPKHPLYLSAVSPLRPYGLAS
jgi:hypothetical protein